MPELKTVKVDGVDYQAEAKVIEVMHKANEKVDAMQNTITEAQQKLDAMTADKAVLEAERDTLKDRCDGLEAEVAELKKAHIDEATIAVAVARRVKILDAAKNAGVEVKEDMDELAIQKAVIMSVFPKANLDGKEANYIDARFDGAIEVIELRADGENRQAASAETQHTDGAGETEVVDSADAYAKYVETLKNGYKVKED